MFPSEPRVYFNQWNVVSEGNYHLTYKDRCVNDKWRRWKWEKKTLFREINKWINGRLACDCVRVGLCACAAISIEKSKWKLLMICVDFRSINTHQFHSDSKVFNSFPSTGGDSGGGCNTHINTCHSGISDSSQTKITQTMIMTEHEPSKSHRMREIETFPMLPKPTAVIPSARFMHGLAYHTCEMVTLCAQTTAHFLVLHTWNTAFKTNFQQFVRG